MPRIKFSDRYGFTSPRETFQINEIDQALKNRLWNIFKNTFIDTMETNYDNDFAKLQNKDDKKFIVTIYDEFLKCNMDPLVLNRQQLRDNLKQIYFKLPWYEIYNLIEFLPAVYYKTKKNFYLDVNKVLEQEKSGYRFVDKCIAPIIDEVEITEIEQAISSEYAPVKNHILKALELLSDRETPDYINSIKESISAIESLCKILLDNKGTALGSCIKQLNLDLDKHFKEGLIKLYSWTSTDDGIRHGYSGEKIKSSFDEAKFMIVACSAFINYLISKSSKNNQ